MERNITTSIVLVSNGLLTERQYIIVMEFCYVIMLVLSSLGVISNIITIRTFIVMGLKDGITIAFFTLTIFDLAYLVAAVVFAVSLMVRVFERRSIAFFTFTPNIICVFLANVMILLNITNTLTTTFLSVVRCLCVARALQFKNMLTRLRTITFMITFAIFAIVIYTPILASMKVIKMTNPGTNISRLTLWASADKDTIKQNVWIVTEIILPVATQIITITCVVIMADSLRTASKFRQSTTLISIKEPIKTNRKNTPSHKDTTIYSNDFKRDTTKLTKKDLLVVQQVVLISAVFIVCNIPKLLISLSSIIEPNLTIGHENELLYYSVNTLRKIFEIINAAVNFIIYYNYNTKFRSAFSKVK